MSIIRFPTPSCSWDQVRTKVAEYVAEHELTAAQAEHACEAIRLYVVATEQFVRESAASATKAAPGADHLTAFVGDLLAQMLMERMDAEIARARHVFPGPSGVA